MTKANIAREMTNKAVDAYKAKREEKVRNFCDSILDEEIQKAANSMTSLIIIRYSFYPEIIDWEMVAEYLRENDYTVTHERENKRLEIIW